MRKYKPLKWPRFRPFYKEVDEMPSHRINIYDSHFAYVLVAGWGAGMLSMSPWPILVAVCVSLFGLIWTWRGPRCFIPAPNRAASNYGVRIIFKKGTPEYVIQQEIFESRYWLRRPWDWIDFYSFYCYYRQIGHSKWWTHESEAAHILTAEHLSSVECQSRAQEIRAKYELSGAKQGMMAVRIYGAKAGFVEDNWAIAEATRYARSIHNASSYPFFKAAGWDEERVYQEITQWL